MRMGGLIPTITNWPYFGDHPLARFRRSPSGSISAITRWLYSTDHQQALPVGWTGASIRLAAR
jgi:hypothetical protein